jgi:cytosine/adenosine deaminase-related metal-dependent hydrolase
MPQAVTGKYVLTCDSKGSVIKNGAVIFDHGTIIDFGPFNQMQHRHSLEKVYGSPNHVVLPGLVNSHQHGYGINLLRVTPGDEPLERWVINTWYHPDGRSVPVFYENTLLAGLKMIRSGVTTAVHHYYFTEAHSEKYLETMASCLQAYKDLGMRVALAPNIRDRHQFAYMDDYTFISKLPTSAVDSLKKMGKIPFQYPTTTQYFDTFNKLRSKHESGKTRFLYGPSGPQWCSPQLLNEMNERSKHEGIGIHMHVLESPVQKKYGDREYSGGLIGYLEELGLLNPRLTLAHGVYLTVEEIKKLARANCKVAHDPSSNLKLFNGVARIRDMVEEGLSVGLATDNSSLDDDEDMFREMRLCSILQRPPRIDASPIASSVILNMNVANGAKIAQFEDAIGPIERGKRADLVLLDFSKIEEPFIGPEADMPNLILNLANKNHVDTVLVDGSPILERGRATRIDEGNLIQSIKEKYRLKGDNPESRNLRQSIVENLIKLYSAW